MDLVRDWIKRQLENPQLVVLAVMLATSLVLVIYFGSALAPVLASMVIAYLLDGLVVRLEQWRMSRTLATVTVWLIFVAILVLVISILVPLLSRQLTQAVQELPKIVTGVQEYLLGLSARYPTMFTPTQIEEFLSTADADLGSLRQTLVSRSLLVGVSLIYIMVYIFLLPLLVFFFLKDKEGILRWMARFVPRDDQMLRHVWLEVDTQLANYVRGKFIELVIVWAACYVVFVILGLNYAMLLSVSVGISVLVPYIGAVVVTFPVAFVAFAQWGLSAEMAYVMAAYGIIQALDGNVLVPLLFSEAVNLHPVAIISAVLFFGALWGFWGVFFAIPLAVVVNAVINAWSDVNRQASQLEQHPPDELVV